MNVQRDIEANKTIVVNMQQVKIRVLYNYKTALYATLIEKWWELQLYMVRKASEHEMSGRFALKDGRKICDFGVYLYK